VRLTPGDQIFPIDEPFGVGAGIALGEELDKNLGPYDVSCRVWKRRTMGTIKVKRRGLGRKGCGSMHMAN